MRTPEELAKQYCDQFSWNDPREEDALEAFIAGYQAAQQWISVKDRLPECSTGVLIYVNFQAHNITFRYYTVALFNGTSWDDNSRNFVTHWMSPPIVTHWMPLPKPPEEGL